MRPRGARIARGQDKIHRLKGTLKRWRSLVTAATVIPCASLLLLLPRPVAADHDGASTTGTIQGEVRITRKLTSKRMRFRLYPGFRSAVPPAETEPDERRNVIIYLKSAPRIKVTGSTGAPSQIAQHGETFIPHVLPIVRGARVDFPNEDPIFHNVFSLSGTRSFDLGRYPKGESRSVTFDQTGIVPVFCHLHSHMSAVIVVLDNPFFTVPDADGSYRIESVPPGIYTVVGWHERSEPVEYQLEVIAGQSAELDFMIPIEDVSGSSQ